MIGSHSLGIFAGQAEPETDPYWDDVVALLGWDGQIGATSVIDDKTGATWSREGTASVTGAQAKAGDASMTCDSLGDSWYRNTNLLFSSEHYTVEGWVYLSGAGFTGSGIGDDRHALVKQSKNISGGAFGLAVSGSIGSFRLFMDFRGGTAGDGSIEGTTILNTDTWYHFAATWDGTNQRGFVNGNMEWEVAKTFGWKETGLFRLGRHFVSIVPEAEFCLNGYMDEIRLTRNVARYTASFTPPSAPFPRG